MKHTLLFPLLFLSAFSQAQQRVAFTVGSGASWYGDATEYARFSPVASVAVEDRLNDWAVFAWGVGYRLRGNTGKGFEVQQHTVPVSLGFDFGKERGLLVGLHFMAGIQAGTRFLSKEGDKRTTLDHYRTDRLNPEVGARLSIGWRLQENVALRIDWEQAAFDIFPTLPGTTRPAGAYVGMVWGL